MKIATYKKLVLAFTGAGFLFSGYLSLTKFISQTCAFNEPCPYVFGYPACYYGFIIFAVLFIASLLFVFGKIEIEKIIKINFIVSGIGILFAGFLTVPEIFKILIGTGGFYSLGLPTCAYGLIFYLAICNITFDVRRYIHPKI